MKFSELAQVFERLDDVTARNEMIEILAEVYKTADPDEVAQVTYLMQGRLVPKFVDLEFGVADRLLVETLAQAFDREHKEVSEVFREIGDLGSAAERLTKHGGTDLTVGEVFERLREVARAEGAGSQERKVQGLAALLRDLDARSNRYLPRIPIGRLRLGVGDPTVMDALSVARVGDKSERKVIERAYNLTSDLGLVAREYVQGGRAAMDSIRVCVGYPVRMAQAERLSSGAEIIEKIGRAAVEPKFDGFRVQIHRNGPHVSIYSRNLEDMTGMFPDVTRAVLAQVRAECAIFEGEAMGVDPTSGEFLPFQRTVSRKRKHGIEEAAEKMPLTVRAFDVLFDGEDVTTLPLTARRKRLQTLIEPGDGIVVSEVFETDDAEAIDRFFGEKVDAGLEGIVAKRLNAPYEAGKRNFSWIKLKRSYSSSLNDTLDCVLVGYWRGQGKRAAWGIGALLSAVWDSDAEKYKTIARIGTGYSDEEWVRIREMLDANVREDRPVSVDSHVIPDVWTEPAYVVEVLADEITLSPTHTAGRTGTELGMALRFPRVVNFVREDKGPTDATTVAEARLMFDRQGRDGKT
jgi:DNA ligase-1